LIGSNNEKFIVVNDGVSAADEIVMNPRAHLARVGLKDVEDSPQ
jgi:hypothetical protein